MSASASDYFLKATPVFSTTIGAGGVASDVTTTIPLTSVSNLPTDTGLELVINRVDSNGDPTNNYETVRGIISGMNLANAVRGVEGTAQAWAAGVVVEMLMTADMHNRMVTGIVTEHNQDGTHGNITQADGGYIKDTSGNEFVKFSKTASAVNEFTVKNAATGNPAELQATGGDTNIDLALQPKGTGALVVKGTSTSSAEIRLSEDTDNGTNYVGLKAPASTSNLTFTLPSADGSSGQSLTTNGSGTLSFSTTGSTDGWTAESHTWTYASASTFTISGVDLTSVFTKGTKLKFTQTTAKYAVVASSSFSTDTTVTIVVNTDYTIANAAISSPYYSYQSNPQGYPGWFTYSPTRTGWTSPTGSIQYCIEGGICSILSTEDFGGTSNGTSWKTITLPITPATISSKDRSWISAPVQDNTSWQTLPGHIRLEYGDLTLVKLGKTVHGGSWTGSGTATICINFHYQI